MPVLVIADVQGQTHAAYDQMLEAFGPALEDAKGFIAHGAGATGNTWRTFEIWETQADAAHFFAHHVHPNLPPGVKPARTVVPLHALMLGPLMLMIRDREREQDADTYVPGRSRPVRV